MSLIRRAKSRDANEPAIVKALRSVGATVQPLSESGVPDLLVGYRGVNYLLEAKLPAGPKGGVDGRTLTPQQSEWFAKWRGRCCVVRTPEQALIAIGALPSVEIEIIDDDCGPEAA